MKNELLKKGPNVPTDPQTLKFLEQQIELGELGEIERGFFHLPFLVRRYLVTYMNSQTQGRIRSVTVVTITNQSRLTNRVKVAFFRGADSSEAGSCTFSIPPGLTFDFSTRNLPGELTVANCVSKPELTFDEGRAVVSSIFPEIAVSSRVYYTSGSNDETLLAITDSKVVVFGEGNKGD